MQLWTVVRFPNGSWSYGGRPDSPEYAQLTKPKGIGVANRNPEQQPNPENCRVFQGE